MQNNVKRDLIRPPRIVFETGIEKSERTRCVLDKSRFGDFESFISHFSGGKNIYYRTHRI